MAITTETILSEWETRHPRDGDLPSTSPPSRSRRRIGWAVAAVACAAAVAVGVTATVDDGTDATTSSNRTALIHEADRYVESLGSRAASASGSEATDTGNREALVQQADRYVESLDARAASASASADDSSVDDPVPGSRGMPSR